MDNDTLRLVSWKKFFHFHPRFSSISAVGDSISLVVHTSLGISASAFNALGKKKECRMCRHFCKVNTDDFVIYRQLAHIKARKLSIVRKTFSSEI